MAVDELIAWMDATAPGLSQDALVAFENEIGATLPPDYGAFLQQVNGGGLGGVCGFKADAPDGGVIDTCQAHVLGARGESYLSVLQATEDMRGRIKPETLCIMDDCFGNPILLGIAGEYRGNVCFLNHEEHGWRNAATQIAASFAQFIRIIQTTESMDD